MNMKLWIIIALSTLLLENKTDKFTITFKSDNEEFKLDVSAIKSTYWNIYIPDEADKNKLIPLNYMMSKEGVFRTILMGELKMNEFINFNGVDWDKTNKVGMLQEGAKDINIERLDDKKMIRFSQKNGKLIGDKEEITVTWE
ncbi:MAG: hypothetical protein P1P88_13050 [Bacteroidales bacterium]|nr:hypothetical protein [Bacteroidales bacterium]